MKKSPFVLLSRTYESAWTKARDYIMAEAHWSQRTYYRKMEQLEALTEEESNIVAAAYIQFVEKPLMELRQQILN